MRFIKMSTLLYIDTFILNTEVNANRNLKDKALLELGQ